MDRQKRAAETENPLWGNPCEFDEANAKPTEDANPEEVAKKIIALARKAQVDTEAYKQSFAKLHSYSSYDTLINDWRDFEWLRKFSLPDEVLPKEKELHKPLPDEYMKQVMSKIDTVLPSMHKALKLVIAGLNSFAEEGLNVNIIADDTLKENINQTMHNARTILCYFNDIMKARNLEILLLPDSEAPNFKGEDKLNDGLLLYRDTMAFLDYLVQVFQNLYA